MLHINTDERDGKSRLTILNSMASADFATALQVHREWGLEWLDLRDAIHGKWLLDLDLETARQAQAQIEVAGLRVYCMSTSLFGGPVENGEAHFAGHYLDRLAHTVELGRIFKPVLIRMLAAQLPSRTPDESAVALLRDRHGWLFDHYRRGIDEIAAAGFTPTIENEARRSFLSATQDFTDFFTELDRTGVVTLTWDVQNQWATGVSPSLATYEVLRPLIGYYHVKGGRSEPGAESLAWNVALEEASWPVREITERVVADGISPVICINPPQHGAPVPGYDYADVTRRDIEFLRQLEGIV